MTTPHRTLQMALDALDAITDDVDGTGLNTMPSFDKAIDAITALREALAAPQAEPWMPIESAPKHTEVLVWREDSGPFIANLTTPDAVVSPEEMEREGLDFPDDFEEWWSDAYGWQDGSERPTHWMPLPAAPEAAPPAAPQPKPVLWAVTVDGRFQPHFCAKTRAGAEGLRDALKHQTAPCDLKPMQVVSLFDASPAAPAPVVPDSADQLCDYLAAQSRAPVVPLTDEQILDLAENCTAQFHDLLAFARSIEQAHGIRGGGK